MRVFVYFNLHKKTFSIKALEGANKGLVIGHSDAVTIADPKFSVSEAGRQRVLQEKRKNVHAGVVGKLVKNVEVAMTDRKVSYNPYFAGFFFTKDDKQPVLAANVAVMQVQNKIPSIFVG